MAEAALKLENEHYTYADYLTWDDDKRWEIIAGVVYAMSPAPSPQHQALCLELGRQLANYLLDKACQAFAAPFDVRLPKFPEADDAATDTVVQPDLVVICDPKKIDKRGCRGAPDMVIEILSPHTAKKDSVIKTALYERHGVKEYWIVQPFDGLILVRLLDPETKKFGPTTFHDATETLDVATLPGLGIDLSLVFKSLAQP